MRRGKEVIEKRPEKGEGVEGGKIKGKGTIERTMVEGESDWGR